MRARFHQMQRKGERKYDIALYRTKCVSMRELLKGMSAALLQVDHHSMTCLNLTVYSPLTRSVMISSEVHPT